ncbi:hypothetical protein ACOSQ2_007664 [Xanthoceras sorbifolium]
MEYVMSFLMGLNDSFTQVKGQLLLMDPLPSINRAFSLVITRRTSKESQYFRYV